MDPIPQRPVVWRTYADCAAHGIWHEVTCGGCLRVTYVSCLSMVRRGLGHLDIIETKHRLQCSACGHHGAGLFLRGNWTGPAHMCPPGWAETVEDRMPKDADPMMDER